MHRRSTGEAHCSRARLLSDTADLATVQLRTMKRARDIREQLVGLMERVEISMETSGDDDTPVRKALTAGYFYNAAQLTKPTEAQYKTVKQRNPVYIHPGSGALGFCAACPL